MKETVPGLLTQALTPVKSVQNYFARESFMKNADVLANIVTSPDGMQRLKELRKVTPQQPKFWSLLAQTLASGGATLGSEFME
jgi:predicted Zn-dependent protease